jgi:hypothetical protein
MRVLSRDLEATIRWPPGLVRSGVQHRIREITVLPRTAALNELASQHASPQPWDRHDPHKVSFAPYVQVWWPCFALPLTPVTPELRLKQNLLIVHVLQKNTSSAMYWRGFKLADFWRQTEGNCRRSIGKFSTNDSKKKIILKKRFSYLCTRIWPRPLQVYILIRRNIYFWCG